MIVPMRACPFLRSIAVLLTISSWLAISNHCAFAGLSAAEPAAETCPMHSQPAQQKQSSALVCCKILKAPGPQATIKAALPKVQLLSPDGAWFSVLLVAQPYFEPDFVALDTGPPGISSFAESVL
jgi:hypothetical protein